MREGWTYKKLGEVCEYAKTRINSRDISIENYIGVDNLLQNCQGRSLASKIPDELGLSEYWEGDVLVGNIRPYLKKIWLADCRGGCNGDVLAIRRKHEYTSIIDTSFLFKCLSTNYFFDFAMQYAKGEKMPRGDKKEILKYLIPIPPLAEQKRIVAELDLLQGIIEKKKEQLKAYDQLAQSIFYTMFGDPIDNPNIDFEDGLEKVKYTKKIQSSEYLTNGLIPIISQEEEYISGFWNDENDAFKVDIPLVIFGDHSRVIKYVDFDFVLGADGVKILKPIKSINARYLFSFLKCYNVPSLGYSRHYKLLKEIRLPVPPLSLQQEFAEKVEAIERQKALVQQSIEETQTMFDYTMDKYFG